MVARGGFVRPLTGRRRLVRFAVAGVASAGGAAALSACAPPLACTTSWIGPAGGAFGTAGNWSGGSVPGPADTACSATDSSLVVDGSRAVASAQLLGRVDIATGASLSVTPPAANPSRIGDLRLSGGTVGGTGNVRVDTATLSGGSVATSGLFIAAGPVGVGSNTAVTGPVLSSGTITVASGVTLDAGSFLGLGGTLDLVGSNSRLRVGAGSGTASFVGTTVRGAGRVTGSVAGSPIFVPVAPGGGGGVTVTGSLTTAAGAQVHTVLGDGAEHDRVMTSGAASLSGAGLVATAAPGWVPAAGQQINVVRATGGITTGFGSVSIPPVPGFGVAVRTLPNDVKVLVTHCDPSTRFPGAPLDGANLAGEILVGCDLRQAGLAGANLQAVDFTDADLSDANLAGADVTGVVWANTICPDGTNSDANGDTCAGHLPLVAHVDAADDAVDAGPGDGRCRTAAPERCTLRAAVQEANAWPGADVVHLYGGVTLTLVGSGENAAATGDLDVTEVLTVEGGGATIPSSLEAIFEAFAPLTIRDLTTHAPASGSDVTLERVDANFIDGVNGLAVRDSVLGFIHLTQPSTFERTRFRSETRLASATIDHSFFDRVSANLSGSTVTTSTFQGGRLQASPGGPVLIEASTLRSVELNVGPTVTFHNSIIDLAPDVALVGAPSALCSWFADPTSAGHNVVWNAACMPADPTDVVGRALTLPITGSGGTAHSRLADGSPAIDTGAPTCPALDARGGARPVDGDGNATAVCDRGAVEYDPHPRELTVTATTDAVDLVPGDGACATAAAVCSLRAAVQEAGAVDGRDTIHLLPGATHSLSLIDSLEWGSADGPLDLFTGVVLDGADAAIEAPSGNVLVVWHRAVDVADLRFGSTAWRQLWIQPTGAATVSRTTMANLRNEGSLSLVDSGISSSLVNLGTASVDRSLLEAKVTNGDIVVPFGVTWAALTIRDTTVVGPTDAPPFTATLGTAHIERSTVVSRASRHALWGSAPAVIELQGSIVTSLQSTPSVLCTGVTSLGNNLAADGSCNPNVALGDLAGVDPKVTPLSGFGGPFRSFLPLPGSPAIDSAGAACGTLDVRGRPRPADGDGNGSAVCDRGAVEREVGTGRVFTVNATVDAIDADLGDGVCQTSVVGQCTLRAAVQEANARVGADTIDLAPSATYELTINEPVPAEPLGAAGPLSAIDDVTIRGHGSTIFTTDTWGMVQARTGNFTVEDAVLESRRLTPNHSVGITVLVPSGTATIRRSVVSSAGNAAVDVTGTGAAVLRDAELKDSPLHVEGGSANVRRTLITSTTGVGILQEGGTIDIESSTITRPVAPAGFANPLVTQLIGTMSITQSTVLVNGNASALYTFGTTTVRASVIDAFGTSIACAGTPTSQGFNLTVDGSCGLGAPTDVVVDPQLGPLAANGGPTRTHLPLAGSPAIDTGPASCPSPDQRGVARPVGAACDRGAVEQ